MLDTSPQRYGSLLAKRPLMRFSPLRSAAL